MWLFEEFRKLMQVKESQHRHFGARFDVIRQVSIEELSSKRHFYLLIALFDVIAA